MCGGSVAERLGGRCVQGVEDSGGRVHKVSPTGGDRFHRAEGLEPAHAPLRRQVGRVQVGE